MDHTLSLRPSWQNRIGIYGLRIRERLPDIILPLFDTQANRLLRQPVGCPATSLKSGKSTQRGYWQTG
jgi:hypothetical protein